MDRRKFLESIAALGVSSTLLASPAAARLASLSPSRKKKGKLTVDEDLVCIISDLHVRPGKYQQQHFEKTVEEILALNPRPKRVICLGDVAYLTGKPEEYAVARDLLGRLEEAGMELTITMGNHDRRANFAEAFPEKAAAAELGHRMVYTVKTPRADFIVLDSLQEGENHDKWITPGAIDDEQRAWLESRLAQYAESGKPVFVMAHHPVNETKVGKLLMKCPACCGYIYGHNHIWNSGWIHKDYKTRTMLRTLCMPSTGHWGDIGFALLKLEKDKAVASFVQREFFFPKPLKDGEDKPAVWTALEEEHKDAVCVFPYNL